MLVCNVCFVNISENLKHDVHTDIISRLKKEEDWKNGINMKQTKLKIAEYFRKLCTICIG